MQICIHIMYEHCREHFSQKTKQKQANLGNLEKRENQDVLSNSLCILNNIIERQSRLIPDGYFYHLTIHNKTRNIHKIHKQTCFHLTKLGAVFQPVLTRVVLYILTEWTNSFWYKLPISHRLILTIFFLKLWAMVTISAHLSDLVSLIWPNWLNFPFFCSTQSKIPYFYKCQLSVQLSNGSIVNTKLHIHRPTPKK